MARHTSPPLADEPKFKKRTRVTKTAVGGTRTNIDVAPDDPTLPTQEGDVRKFLDQALTRFNMALDGEAYSRREGMIDALMVDGEGQWDDDIRGKRTRKKRPCLTINRFIPMIAHVANEQRMSRPSIKIDPVGGGADPISAQIRQGLIRHIEVMSSAETVYDTAFERMIEKGWSWYRVVNDWESPLSHNQIIKIEGFTNDFCVYGDPNAEEPTRKDMKFAFVVYDMPRGQFCTQFPGTRAASLTNFSSLGDDANGWLTSDSVRMAEYYYVDEVEAWSVRIEGGEGVWEDEIESRDGLWYDKAQLSAMDEGLLQPEQVTPVPVDLDDEGEIVKRKSFRPVVKWSKITAVDILDGDKGDDVSKNTAGRAIAGKYIPLVMVSGRERMVRGQRRLSGMVRNNREAQRMYNYATSAFVEMIALAPKSPFIAAAGQIEEFKAIWDSLNDENWPYLPYNPVTVNQQNVPPPQRQNVEPPVMALLQAIREFDNDLKIGFNIFDPSLGAPKSDQSGRAVASLQARSDAANMNWMDNSRRAQIFCGEIILHQIPVIYSGSRIIRILRTADKSEEVLINQEFPGPDGKPKNYDMSVGTYSVTVSLGEYASKRQQAVQSLSEIAKNVPQVALPLLPLILDNLDSPMATEAAAIVRRLQPPELQEQGSPEQMRAQFKALMQQHQLLVQALQRANETIQTKQLDNASKEYIAGLQAQAQIATVAMKLDSAHGIQMAIQEYQRLQQLLDLNHDRIQGEQQRAHEVGITAMEAASQPQPAGATA